MYDELELDTLGDEKTALFLMMSDTDGSFNFLISMIYTQLFNLLCEKADDVYGGRLPVHVRCLIDEAANIGQIPNLEKLVATIRSREIAGDKFDEAIIKYVRRKHNALIGERTAEQVKKTIGCVYPRTEEEIMEVKGRCLMTGLPRTFTLSSSEILEALEEVSSAIVEAIHSVLERTPPELTGDISSNGIVMTGGGSLIWGFDKLVASKTGIPTRVADEAVSCVAYGTGNCLENLASMQDGTINLSRKRQMR